MQDMAETSVCTCICSSRYAYIRQPGEFGQGGEKSNTYSPGLDLLAVPFSKYAQITQLTSVLLSTNMANLILGSFAHHNRNVKIPH